MKLLITSLVENNQPIEELSIGHVDARLGNMLQKLKKIKVLHIDHTSEQILIDVAKNLDILYPELFAV